MYAGVPMIGLVCVDSAPAVGFASPKSSSFANPFHQCMGMELAHGVREAERPLLAGLGLIIVQANKMRREPKPAPLV
jgi:hypothetical protein